MAELTKLITPPHTAFAFYYCENCEADRTVHIWRKKTDAKTGEVYYEYMCDACFSILRSGKHP
jgi:hypothetical protein